MPPSSTVVNLEANKICECKLYASGWQDYTEDLNGQSVLLGWSEKVVQPIADAELESACSRGVPIGRPNPPAKQN
jgi:hypothetical protein